MLALDVVEACESDYTSPLILVEVSGKDPRPCIDYRKLNLITRDQTYPIPNIKERIEKFSSARFSSTLDLVRGYWQMPLTKEASRYAAFISPMGTYRPKVLSFGPKNAPYCCCGGSTNSRCPIWTTLRFFPPRCRSILNTCAPCCHVYAKLA